MKNRAVRIALLLLAALGIAGAAYELALLERQSETAAEARRAFDDKARHAEIAVRELRAAQFAYLAIGQGSSFWVARAGTLMPAIAADIRSLCAMDAELTAAAPRSSFCSRGQDALATLQRIDASVQGYLQNEQRLLASDLVFTDLREANQVLTAWIDGARERRADADRAAADTRQKRRVATAAGAAVFALLVLVLLTPIGKPAAGPIDAAAEKDPSPERGRALLGDIAHTPAPAREDAAGGLSLRDVDSPVEHAPAPPSWPRPAGAATDAAADAIDLAAAAALCTDLACVHDSTDLAPLLQRVASLLDAAGLIVWVDDAATGLLRPALSHGYSPHALARISGIAKDADNATASACRDRRLRVVEGEGPGNGALAAPLLWSKGCLGVMTAEVRHGRERDPATQAVATMVAAQLATLVTPQPARASGAET